MKKKIIGTILIAGMLFTSTCMAKSVSYSSKFVDSNEYTFITSATKETTSDVATVNVSTMYKSSNGKKGEVATNYKYLYVQLGSSGGQAASQKVTKGKSKDFNLVTKYKAKGTTLSMYAMGNDPELDCYIDGNFNVY